MGIINYTWIKFGALWSLLEFIYVTANTGGINSPAMVWMTIIGVVVILYFNRLATQISIAFLFSLYLVFYLLGQQGVVSSEVLVEQQTIAWALTYKFSVIVMVFLGALATDWMYGHLLEEIDTKNKELEDTQQKILQAQAHKDEFIASIGHELRTPMNAILGFNDILRQELARRGLLPLNSATETNSLQPSHPANLRIRTETRPTILPRPESESHGSPRE